MDAAGQLGKNLLSSHPVLATGALEEARNAVTEVYLPHELINVEGRDEVAMVLNAVKDRNFTLGYLTYGSSARLTMPATEDTYHVNLTIAGSTFADRQDGERATTRSRLSGVVLLPDQLNRVQWTPDAEQLILKIPRRSLEGHLADLLGKPVRSVVHFDFQVDLTTARGQALLSAVEFLTAEMERPGGIADNPLARDQLEAYVMSQLLTAVPNPYTEELSAPAEPVQDGRLKPVVEYMESNADLALSPTELAKVGCMSVRSLHASFQKTFGESPMAYLRRIRLDHVRTELLNSREPDLQITDVAMRWGFFHLSRFAQQYRERYGELPSETIRRG
ncbi:AraC family transcriptional regulator [Saccharopolyspora spinosa]|uniref:AraC-like protein n=1 Tax=Saccharopolyspora spinosa TaxID=60894 RepID=A0A2N3Y0W4_SACSN|nr:AraC family transcriptional regulator [Saccharopolyspora spinosa]PKW16568.1 AraC-like protein [Saccharopolyspora spinosa]